MKSRVGLIAALLMIPAATAAAVPERFGEDCQGSEIVQTGSEAPRTLPYTIALGIDLEHGTYCYAACSKAQTYPIKAVSGSLLTLADLDIGEQSRHILLDRTSGKLIDHQQITVAGISVKREAEAQCTPALYPAAG